MYEPWVYQKRFSNKCIHLFLVVKVISPSINVIDHIFTTSHYYMAMQYQKYLTFEKSWFRWQVPSLDLNKYSCGFHYCFRSKNWTSLLDRDFLNFTYFLYCLYMALNYCAMTTLPFWGSLPYTEHILNDNAFDWQW